MLDTSGHGHKFRKKHVSKTSSILQIMSGKKRAIFSNVYSVEPIGNLCGLFREVIQELTCSTQKIQTLEPQYQKQAYRLDCVQ